MDIEIDWSKVVDVDAHIEEAGIWTIGVVFDDGQVLAYGYNNIKDFTKDYTKIISNMEWRKKDGSK